MQKCKWIHKNTFQVNYPTIVFPKYFSLCSMLATFKKNLKLYLMEALGLAIFMVSACFFGAILEAKNSFIHQSIHNDLARQIIMGIIMGATALFIFYSKWTAPSGSHINPAVTFAFLRAGKINKNDAIFYIIFQFIGGYKYAADSSTFLPGF